MKKYTTVLFDYDGTIMDTNEVVYNSWQHTFEKLTGDRGDDQLIFSTYGEPLSTCMETVFGKERAEEAIEIYREYQKLVYKKDTHLFPGVKEMLDRLKEEGYKLGIVTSRLKEATHSGLRDHGIEGCFDVVLTANDTDKHKPDPEPLLKAAEMIGSTVEECIYVGDSKFDLLCARNANMKSVLVGWAVAYNNQEKEIEPDFMMEEAEDIFKIL